MGTIQQVFDNRTERRLAMKVLHEELAEEDGGVDLFRQEARLTARLQHPNIIPVHEVGFDPQIGHFFTMPAVEGSTLDELLDDQDALDGARAGLAFRLDVALKVLSALEYAHSRGLVHGDVKPQNILVADFGAVYLLDWGLSKVVDRAAWTLDPHTGRSDDTLSASDSFPGGWGSLAYLAPELLAGKDATVGSDQYAFGTVLYHLVTERSPFPFDLGTPALHLRIANGDFTPPDKTVHGHEIPDRLVSIIMLCMGTDPAERYPSLAALRHDLETVARGAPVLRVRRFQADETIFWEGEASTRAYIVHSGRVALSVDEDEDTTTVEYLGPGDVLGLEALAGEPRRVVTARACELTELALVDRAMLDDVMSSVRPWFGTVIKAIVQRARSRLASRVRSHQALRFLSESSEFPVAGEAAQAPLARRAAASSRLLAAFAAGRSNDVLFELTCNFVYERVSPDVPFDRLGVALYDEPAGLVRHRWSRQNYPGGALPEDYSAPLSGSSLEEVARTGRPRIIADLVQYLSEHPGSNATKRILALGIRSSLTCPLIADDRLLGFLFFSNQVPHRYRDAHIDSYLAVANDVAQVLGASLKGADHVLPNLDLARLGASLVRLVERADADQYAIDLLGEISAQMRDEGVAKGSLERG